MSEETKKGRAMIYDFLESRGVDLIPIRRHLRALLIAYAQEENAALLDEVVSLRDRVRSHRAIIRKFK